MIYFYLLISWSKFYRHGLHKNWDNFTIFVMHLSVCDILYCTICLPFYATVYLGIPWVFGKFWCVGSIALAYIFAYVDWMALSLIALSRALSICAPTLLDKLSYGFKAKFSIIFVWVFVILFMVPSFLEVINFSIDRMFDTKPLLWVFPLTCIKLLNDFRNRLRLAIIVEEENATYFQPTILQNWDGLESR